MKTFRCLCFIFVLIAGVNPAHSQIPVTDGASLAQQIQQVQSWVQQLKAMEDQYQQLEGQYRALTGNRGYGNLLNNPALQQYLPADWQLVYNQIRSGSLSSGAQALRQQFGDARNCNLYPDDQTRANCQQATGGDYQSYDVFQNALRVANQKPQQIQGLINSIQGTDDPKAIAELQARIAGEQAAMQNEMIKVQLATQLAETQNKLAKEQTDRDQTNAIRKSRQAAESAILKSGLGGTK